MPRALLSVVCCAALLWIDYEGPSLGVMKDGGQGAVARFLPLLYYY
jgi:hypothetical protein